jgi:hypothetical protein
VIFSLLANSRARSKGILSHVSMPISSPEQGNLPNTLEMHGADLNDMARLLAFQYAVTPTSCHSRNIQKLGAVDHVIV